MINNPITPATLRAKAAEAENGRVQYASSFLMLAADRMEELEAALADCLAGLNYIRQNHGDLYGVGFNRCEAYRALISQPGVTK